MKKVLASCAALALFAQFTDAKVAGKPAQDKEKKVEQIDADECNCERDPFARGYITFGFGYGSTKDKLESDLTVRAQLTTAAGTTVDTLNDADHLKKYNEAFDSVTALEKLDGTTALVEGKNNAKQNKNHHNLVGSVGAGWLFKAGANGYIGLEGNFGFGSNSTTSLQFVEVASPDGMSHIDLKRSGANIGIGAILGWKFGQGYLLYGKAGVRSASVEIVPPVAKSYTKRTISPEFGVGVKKALNNGKTAVGLEATYTLNKKIKMNDQGKDYVFTGMVGANDTSAVLDNMRADDDDEHPVKVDVNDNTETGTYSRAVVKSKKAGTWKVALTVSMPLA